LGRSGSRSLSATRPGRGHGKTPLLARPAYARFHRHGYGEQGLTDQDLDEHGNRIRGAAGRAVIERHNQMQEEATGTAVDVQEAIARMESYVRRREEQQLKDEQPVCVSMTDVEQKEVELEIKQQRTELDALNLLQMELASLAKTKAKQRQKEDA